TYGGIVRRMELVENEAGKLVVQCLVIENDLKSLRDISFSAILPGDKYAVGVWDNKATLCRQVRPWEFEPVDEAPFAEVKDYFEVWLHANVGMSDGSLERPAVFPIMLKAPEPLASILRGLKTGRKTAQNRRKKP
ncbi:MAG: hypothetical protein ACPLQO_11540, partial [Desulfotomaculales bacterium]